MRDTFALNYWRGEALDAALAGDRERVKEAEVKIREIKRLARERRRRIKAIKIEHH